MWEGAFKNCKSKTNKLKCILMLFKSHSPDSGTLASFKSDLIIKFVFLSLAVQ